MKRRFFANLGRALAVCLRSTLNASAQLAAGALRGLARAPVTVGLPKGRTR